MPALSTDGIRHDLLQPSLSGRAALKAAPYSEQTGLLTAFLGGPIAITSGRARRT